MYASGARSVDADFPPMGIDDDGVLQATVNFTDAELAAIVDEAHRLGHKVAAHATGRDGIVGDRQQHALDAVDAAIAAHRERAEQGDADQEAEVELDRRQRCAHGSVHAGGAEPLWGAIENAAAAVKPAAAANQRMGTRWRTRRQGSGRLSATRPKKNPSQIGGWRGGA
jgi:hypothetical protein